jgi:hypothetical protein
VQQLSSVHGQLMIQIRIVNVSTVLTDLQVQTCMAALQAQVHEDLFTSPWGIDATLTFMPKGQSPMPGEWQLLFADDSDQAGALGYHETTMYGNPIGYVFAKTSINDGVSWTVCASHELLEMLVDPDIQTVEEQDNGGGVITLRMREACDPVESDSLGYQKNDILVSDFILPAWFNSSSPSDARLDFCGHCKKPFEVLADGYMGVLYATTAGWTQIDAEGNPGGKEVAALNRRGRRAKPDCDWKRSER